MINTLRVNLCTKN